MIPGLLKAKILNVLYTRNFTFFHFATEERNELKKLVPKQSDGPCKLGIAELGERLLQNDPLSV